MIVYDTTNNILTVLFSVARSEHNATSLSEASKRKYLGRTNMQRSMQDLTSLPEWMHNTGESRHTAPHTRNIHWAPLGFDSCALYPDTTHWAILWWATVHVMNSYKQQQELTWLHAHRWRKRQESLDTFSSQTKHPAEAWATSTHMRCPQGLRD